MEFNAVFQGDCLDLLAELEPSSVSLFYLDPPFFTGKKHRSLTRDGLSEYKFDDLWSSADEYRTFLLERISAAKRALRSNGSIFVHCDHNASHIVRGVMDVVFGEENFQSEIVWSYKRWSNAKKGLLQQHQNIYFYSKNGSFKWNSIVCDYSPTTNVDQILHKRARDKRGKAVYLKDSVGDVVYATEKRGVPLGDVWEIPYLNPKAKERCGYPTQKPLVLLERIIELTTDEGDLVVDPFCGSGTTLVAAKLLGRKFVGFDFSREAVELSIARLAAPIRTESALLKIGMASYKNGDPWVEAHLEGFSYARVQRNAGADAVLREAVNGRAAFLRVQKRGETLEAAVRSLEQVVLKKGKAIGFVIATEDDFFPVCAPNITVLTSPALQLKRKLMPASSIAAE